MQIASIPGPKAGISPFESLQFASAHLVTAQEQLTFTPIAMQNPATMVASAATSAKRAVTILEPLAGRGDMFTDRAVAASITASHEGLALLEKASSALQMTTGGTYGGAHELMEQAKDKFRIAEGALWME